MSRRWLLLTLVLASACQSAREIDTPLGSYRRSGDMGSYQLRRVGLLPIDGRAAASCDASALHAALSAEFTRVTRFEVIALEARDLEETVRSHAHLRGWYDPRSILALARRYQLDGLLVTTVTQADPYPPQQLDLQIDLVSTETGLVLWTANLQLDSSLARVRKAVERYRAVRRPAPGETDSRDGTLLSPDRFARFAAYELARLL
jgi:hypothetical protein